MEPKPERDAFTRALTYLSPNRQAVWASHLAAVGSGLVVVLLLVILWLFVDLMVYRGRLPSYDELTPAERQRFVLEWNSEDFGEQSRKTAVELRTAGLCCIEFGADVSWSELRPELSTGFQILR